jgi:hypothetical protein
LAQSPSARLLLEHSGGSLCHMGRLSDQPDEALVLLTDTGALAMTALIAQWINRSSETFWDSRPTHRAA